MGGAVGAVIAIGVLFTWIIAAMIYHPCKPNIKRIQPKTFVYALSLSLIVIGTWIRFQIHLPIDPDFWIRQLLFDLGPNMMMAGATVLVIEALTRWWQREEEREKEKLAIIRQLGNRSNDVVLSAAQHVFEKEWHKDGSLCGVNWTWADWTKVYLPRAVMTDVRFARCTLSEMILYAAKLDRCYLLQCTIEHATLDMTTMQEAVMEHVLLSNSRLKSLKATRAKLVNVDLISSDLASASFDDATLHNCNFTKANLKNASFVGAKLEHIIFDDVDLTSTNFVDATFFAVRWPLDFDPLAAGAIYAGTIGNR